MRGIKAYQQNNLDSVVSVSSPHKITQMLMEGAEKNIKIALFAQERSDFTLRSESVSKAQSIVLTLASTLDDSKAEELCQNLRLLYDYILRSLTEFISEGDREKAESALLCMSKVREGWQAIAPGEKGVEK